MNGIIFGKQGGEDERLVAKSRLAQNLVSKTLSRSPTALSSNPSQRLVNPTANCSTLDLSSTGNLSRWIRKRTTHQTLKDGTQTLTRTRAQGKPVARSNNYRWSKFVSWHFGQTSRQCRVYGESLHVRTIETWSSEGSKMQQVNTNAIIQELFMAASMKAAVHVGKLGRYCMCYEEHNIRRGSAFVLHHAEIDSWSRRWNM